jgi:hypothetical protein
MIDRLVAHEGAVLLTTAIGELMEDGAPAALVRPTAGFNGYSELAAQLERDGADIATLAAAVAVLVRRSPRRASP